MRVSPVNGHSPVSVNALAVATGTPGVVDAPEAGVVCATVAAPPPPPPPHAASRIARPDNPHTNALVRRGPESRPIDMG